MPPRPTSPRSSSNCGFTRIRNSAPGAAAATRRGNTLATEMNETSTVTSDGARRSAFGFEIAHVDFDGITRASCCSFHASWLVVTSTA